MTIPDRIDRPKILIFSPANELWWADEQVDGL